MFKIKLWGVFLVLGFTSVTIIYNPPVLAQENRTSQFYNNILASSSQVPIVPTGRADTSVDPSCRKLINEIVKCESGNGSCVVLKFRKGTEQNPNAYAQFTEDAKRCAGSNSNSLNDNQKLDLINKVCFALPPANPSDRVFFCQACIGRGVTKPSSWSDEDIRNRCNNALPADNSPRKLVKREIDQNGQVKEVLATKINIKEKPLGVAQASGNNFYLKVANQLADPFTNQSNLVLANIQNQQRTLIIEASGISNLVAGQGIVPSQGETCTFSFSPGPEWRVVSPPANGVTNRGICSTEVKIESVATQTAFWSFGQIPVWAQGGGNQPGVQVCVGSTCASVNLDVVAQVVADASTNVLNFFQNQCFFPGQTLADGTVCEVDKALSVRIFKTILNIAPIVAFVVALVASILLLIGKEKEGRSLLEKTIKGLIAIFAITTIVGLVEQSIQTQNVNPITAFVTSVVNSFIIPLASIVSLIYFIIGSYKVMFAGDKEDQVAEGWKHMQNAVIGFVIVLVSFSLAQIIINLFVSISSTL